MIASAPAIPPRPLKPSYDIIVVGAGSGGAAVTRRLVDAGAEVLLIEAGPAGIGIAEIDNPAQWVPLGRGAYDWGYDYAPAPPVNGRTIGIPRGKVLGGSSAINAMMWYRGHPRDYDAWENAGAKGWSFADCLPYFRRCEDWRDGASEWRGAGGPLRIERAAEMHPVAQALIDGAAELGIPVIDDPNGSDNEGAAPANFNIAGGRRWSAVQGYLLPILDHPRLTVLTESLAVGLAVENSRCAGVRHLVRGAERETRAREHVVLALGAIDTPRLLMLAGIGDPAELDRLGIPTVHALPGVGRNLQDHPLAQACVFRAKRPLGPVTGNGGGSMVNWKSRPDLPRADLHAFPVQGNSAEPAIRARYEISGDVFSFGAGVMRSKSVGHLRLLEARPGGALEIQPNFLAEPEDLEAMVTAVEAVIEMAAARANAHVFAGFAAPDRRLSRKETVAFVRDACSTFFHTCGTCRMGEDEEAVVDSRLAVRGIGGLTVADASVIPIIPSCNTHAPATMIGERAADFILQAA
ncbi:glucose-methanol-choline oxidoreductase [Mesorhizobium sp. M2A.F.Ca.ET.042.01.1.1]|uniref:GMC family oxidoreductase n=1 Tax=Mesorhizobium sp. M2A.F.Ca.ET.042.01.1.1 TaxID=2496745 RepID=UPI000FC9F1E8|nr:GMC family oxidoreductase N-terminal domain-containing protein [Mesorhizobium sp. M2A.F.Ca.ET.042.01.1.1]RUX33674.1 glucose-methanol-choline oxidoreductase [Mesorhizobium sp. M2A.F.Ca.ET.042.01.1.1]